MIRYGNETAADVRLGSVCLWCVMAGKEVVWERGGLYLWVEPTALWLGQDVAQGDVDVFSNTQWVAGDAVLLDVSPRMVELGVASESSGSVTVSCTGDWEVRG